MGAYVVSRVGGYFHLINVESSSHEGLALVHPMLSERVSCVCVLSSRPLKRQILKLLISTMTITDMCESPKLWHLIKCHVFVRGNGIRQTLNGKKHDNPATCNKF